jgi:hypothetical protein
MNKNTASLWRDWRYAAGAIALLLAVTFALNYVSSNSDLAKDKSEILRTVEDAERRADIISELPSPLSEATDRTFGAVYGLIDLFNIIALVAVASLVAFHLMKFAFPNSLSQIGREFDNGWGQMLAVEKTRWKIAAWLIVFFAIVHGRAEATGMQHLVLPVSEEGEELIIHYEVGGKSYYEKYLTKPTVPAWQSTVSGVTVCFGVDVGHMTDAQIKDAFDGIVSDSYILQLQSVSGLKGRSAYYNGLPKVRHLRFTWQQAELVFERNTLPRYTAMTASAFRIDDERLHPHENSALVSLVFNRGASMSSSSSRREMRDIRYDLGRGYAGLVPGHIRSMKRLWSYTKLKGLHLRRDAEADLFSWGSRLRLSEG